MLIARMHGKIYSILNPCPASKPNALIQPVGSKMVMKA